MSGPALVGVIPLNALDRAKSRLAGALTPQERRSLALWLAGRTLAALRASGVVERVAVVSPDSEALAWAAAEGAEPLAQPGRGLNAGLALARAWAVRQEAGALLIALGDLPLLSGDEVRRFVAMGRLHERLVALATDRARDGTNLLLARPPELAPLAYGRGSFARHRRLTRRAGAPALLYRAPGAAFDVDEPADLDELIAAGLWRPTGRVSANILATREEL
ncbi:MAG TPA: 2-phospho-L-lactate guanylyltransferase [Ktedonobacterales bacterium]|nr:2-phospho-L-lactate guanylyltransferase [Ktedonobacterales bacterium]